MNEFKFQKYQRKLDNCQNISKRNIYEQKIKLYSPQRYIDAKDGLLKPTPISNISEYKPNFQPNKPLLVVGYGAITEKSKNMPVVFERRDLADNDVMFEVLFVGVCHSDWHTILNEWKTSKYPVVAGHEMTGIVKGVGKSVTKFKLGDKVALSPLYNSCQQCKECKSGEEQYCENGTTETYNQYERLPTDIKEPSGSVTYGGYCNIMVAKEDFLFKFPDNLPMDRGAPLLCAGITVYNALNSLNIKQGEVLGVAGIGGLGSLLLKICQVRGICTVALTTTGWKLKDSERLGAKMAILMKDKETLDIMEGKLDYIIDTIPFKHDLDPYIKLLKTHGTLCVVGSFFCLDPDFNEIIRKGKKIQGSNTAGTRIIKEFLEFCSQSDVLPDIEIITFDKLNATRDKLVKSECKYRYVIDIKSSIK